jgi:hypothetical protein
MRPNPPALAPALLKYLNENFVERLLTMQLRTGDREYSEKWLSYDNFGDFYAAMKHLFIVSFSRPEMLVAGVLKAFLHKQISTMVQRLPASDGLGFERLDSMLTQMIDANFEKLQALLAEKWPKEYADILERNSRPKAFL